MTLQPESVLRDSSAGVAGWAVLSVDQLRLALPQRDMVSLELAGTLSNDTRQPPQAGRLVLENGEWPAYALDAALLPQPGAARRLCVFFRARADVLGVLCDALVLLPADSDLVAETLPGCMISVHSPVLGYALRDARVIAVTSAQALEAYIAYLLRERPHVAAA